MKYLVTGGSGSGKSTWAEKLVKTLSQERKYYIATMQVYDDESRIRVARHRCQRSELGMETIEREKGLYAVMPERPCAVLLEDVPNLLANEMFAGGDADKVFTDIEALSGRCDDIVIVTNEVCSDGISYTDGTKEYIARLASINKQLAVMCDCVVEVVYSIPLCIKGALPCV